MSTLAANVTGLTANVFSVILFVPGAVAVWRNRNDPHALRGASIAQQVFIVCNAVTWGVYAFLTGAYWAAAPGLINMPLALFTAALIYRVRASVRTASGIPTPTSSPTGAKQVGTTRVSMGATDAAIHQETSRRHRSE